MNTINISATLNLFRLITRPNLCLPQATISTFADLPVPLDGVFLSDEKGNQRKRDVNIKAVVLDKDNCFAIPNTNTVYEPYQEKFEQLKSAYPNGRLLIVSNTAGTTSIDPAGRLASEVQEATRGVNVLKHRTRKPGCYAEILEYFRYQCPGVNITRPDQIAIVGDRITTDVMLANMMGSYAVWVQNGIVPREETSLIYRSPWLFDRSMVKDGVGDKMIAGIAAERNSIEKEKERKILDLD